MSAEPTTIEKLRGLRWSIATFAANTFFVQFTFFGSVFPLFLSALGLSKSQMGFLFSLMPFLGLIAPFIAPWTARFGYKRTYLAFFGIRKIFTALLLLTPFVQANFGSQSTLIFVSIIVACFAFARSTAETARIPWAQEYVPSSIQGKYTATNNFFTSLSGFAAVGIASYVLGRSHELSSFMLLITIGLVAGVISVVCSSFIPGGAPKPVAPGQPSAQRDLWTAFKDRNFMLYLSLVGIMILATVPVASFIPLFMTEQVGLSPSYAVLLQMGTLLGTLVTSYLWGWVADRYGSKPVMVLGISLRLFVPMLLLAIPRYAPWNLYLAVGISLLQGVADMGWGIGSTRILYVSVVPPAKKNDYMALYFAWIGALGGISQLAGGRILDLTSGLTGTFSGLTLDPYTPLFISGVVLTLCALALTRRVRADNQYGMGQFAGIFLRGNPFLAMGSLIRYQYARSESDAVHMTERLGEAKSLLTVDELLDALHDPRFQVRFEALISIARMPPDPRLRTALVEILNGTELALSAMAAWALGRMGDPEAVATLREGLDSEYHSIQAHCARALGSLRDKEVAPLLRERLAEESDKGLQMAYASALGNINDHASADLLLSLLAKTANDKARLELALSLARLLGDEHHFVHLVRDMRNDRGTTVAQALSAFKRKLARTAKRDQEEAPDVDEALNAFAHDDFPGGIMAFVELIDHLPAEHLSETGKQILSECAARLSESGETHLEYLLLALHVLHVGWQ
ncbi:MAG: MFS transporter [Caldilineaceae bacterium]